MPRQVARHMNSGSRHSKLSSRLLSTTPGTAARLPSGQKGLFPQGVRPLQPPLAGLRARGRGQGRPQERTDPARDEASPAPGLGGGRGLSGPWGKARPDRAPHLRQQRLPLPLPLLLARRQAPLALKPGRHRQSPPETSRRAAAVQQLRRTARPDGCRKRRP